MAGVKTLKRYRNTISTIHASLIDTIIDKMIENRTEGLDFDGLKAGVEATALTHEPELVHHFASLNM
jgi:hypothetical protein